MGLDPSKQNPRDGLREDVGAKVREEAGLNRKEFFSLKAYIGHVISDLGTDNYYTTKQPTPGYLAPGVNVRVVYLDEIKSFAFVASRFNQEFAAFCGALPDRHFITTGGVQFRRNNYAVFYKGFWVVPERDYSKVVHGVEALGFSLEHIVPKRLNRDVHIPNVPAFRGSFFDAETSKVGRPDGIFVDITEK